MGISNCHLISRPTPSEGYEDLPGYAHVPAWSNLLHVGNQYAASSGRFDTVISTVVPLDTRGNEKPSLSTHVIHFEDSLGDENEDDLAFARSRFIEGASLVARSIADGKRTLVHCVFGQNRSGSIACAYAVLYLHWKADDAIDYMRQRNFADRQYEGQSPMGNPAFCEVLKELERKRDSIEAITSQRSEHVSPAFLVGNTLPHIIPAARATQTHAFMQSQSVAKASPVVSAGRVWTPMMPYYNTAQVIHSSSATPRIILTSSAALPHTRTRPT